MAKKKGIAEAKRVAIVKRLTEIQGNIDLLSGMWDDRTMDTLILALGIGYVVLNEDQGH